jgi:cytochrome P450 family 135
LAARDDVLVEAQLAARAQDAAQLRERAVLVGDRAEPDLAERDDVLSLLLAARDEDGQPLTDTELRDELMTMLLAGHETTATALAFAFDLLLHNPQTLTRLTDELPDPADAYLNAVVTETLRLRPVIDAAERTLMRPRTIAGHQLPAGIRVYPNITVVHLREDLYPEPTAFRLERFLDGRTQSSSWLPFGGGIRRCIGAALAQAEIAEVLRVVFSRVTLSATRPTTDPVVMRGITLVPRHGTQVEVTGLDGRRRWANVDETATGCPHGVGTVTPGVAVREPARKPVSS